MILGLSSFPGRLCPAITSAWVEGLDGVEGGNPTRGAFAGWTRRGGGVRRCRRRRRLEETRQYIRDFDRIAQTASTAADLYQQMLALHPGRINVTALWNSARSVKG